MSTTTNNKKDPNAVKREVFQQKAAGDDLTLKMVRDNIPAHFFKQNTFRATLYVIRDLIQVAVTGYIHHQFLLPFVRSLPANAAVGPILGNVAIIAAWCLYTVIQGLNFTGVWVMAHECGHRAFSPSNFINDLVGIVLHSALLVPYHSWRITHGNHHKNCSHLDSDTVFVPEKVTVKDAALREAFRESPIASLWGMFLMLSIGWPGYLFLNATGQKYNTAANHFNPSSPLFRPHQKMQIAVSDLALLVTVGCIVYACTVFGAGNVLLWYGMPYLQTNGWLVYITYLQHSDIRLPHYDADNWNFLRGALSTVDRDFSAPLNWWLHHINDSHVVHHLFSTMPFYNAIQVTRKHLKPTIGDYHMTDNRNLFSMLWESWRNCRYVIPSEGIAYFKR